jgi:hypothetical protein
MQPLDGAMPIEVRVGSVCRPGGTAFDDASAQEDIRSARETLAKMTAAGLFSLRNEITYEMEFHLTSAEAWAAFLARPKAGPVERDQDLVDRALASEDGRVVVLETGAAGAYELPDR